MEASVGVRQNPACRCHHSSKTVHVTRTFSSHQPAMPSQHVYLDHLLLQLSKEEFETPSTWLTDHFTIINGGTHAGKSTVSSTRQSTALTNNRQEV